MFLVFFTPVGIRSLKTRTLILNGEYRITAFGHDRSDGKGSFTDLIYLRRIPKIQNADRCAWCLQKANRRWFIQGLRRGRHKLYRHFSIVLYDSGFRPVYKMARNQLGFVLLIWHKRRAYWACKPLSCGVLVYCDRRAFLKFLFGTTNIALAGNDSSNGAWKPYYFKRCRTGMRPSPNNFSLNFFAVEPLVFLKYVVCVWQYDSKKITPCAGFANEVKK